MSLSLGPSAQPYAATPLGRAASCFTCGAFLPHDAPATGLATLFFCAPPAGVTGTWGRCVETFLRYRGDFKVLRFFGTLRGACAPVCEELATRFESLGAEVAAADAADTDADAAADAADADAVYTRLARVAREVADLKRAHVVTSPAVTEPPRPRVPARGSPQTFIEGMRRAARRSTDGKALAQIALGAFVEHDEDTVDLVRDYLRGSTRSGGLLHDPARPLGAWETGLRDAATHLLAAWATDDTVNHALDAERSIGRAAGMACDRALADLFDALDAPRAEPREASP